MYKIKSVTFSENIQSVSTNAFSGNIRVEIYVPDLETWFRICNISTYISTEVYINNEKPVDIVGIEDIIGYSDTFSPRMREIFYLSRIEGLTHREIAERLQISTRMVERYLQQSVIEYRSFFGLNSHDSKNS